MTTNLIHKVTEIREMRTEDAHIHTNMHHTHKDYGRWFESVAVEWWELNSTDQTRGGSRASRRNEELWLKLSSAAESAALTVRCRNRIAGLNSEEKSQGDPVTVLHFAIIWKYTVQGSYNTCWWVEKVRRTQILGEPWSKSSSDRNETDKIQTVKVNVGVQTCSAEFWW